MERFGDSILWNPILRRNLWDEEIKVLEALMDYLKLGLYNLWDEEIEVLETLMNYLKSVSYSMLWRRF